MAVTYKKLWKLLIDKDMKKKELAALAGINPVTISKMSRGDNVTVDVLGKICSALECTLDDIMEFIPDAPVVNNNAPTKDSYEILSGDTLVGALLFTMGASGINSIISSRVHSRAAQIFPRTSTVTLSPLDILLIVTGFIPASAASSFFFISLSMRSFHNFL